MFTGLVEEVAAVERIDRAAGGAQLRLRAQRVLEGLRLGDSISVNGACLTVVAFGAGWFAADAVPETLRRTNLGELVPGDAVNLERALRVGDRLGGHWVTGHIDGVGVVRSLAHEGLARVMTVAAPPQVMRYVVEKGSICVDGVSLTVMDAAADAFRVSVIPHTGAHTTLRAAQPGRRVNLECDLLAKYVERLLQQGGAGHTGDAVAVPVQEGAQGRLSEAFLRAHGFA
ncbi:MAG: riboflavin synthase [Alicyclobacillus sp.]|nr:riboflavin synthase [Alicyclobacillus sp.]